MWLLAADISRSADSDEGKSRSYCDATIRTLLSKKIPSLAESGSHLTSSVYLKNSKIFDLPQLSLFEETRSSLTSRLRREIFCLFFRIGFGLA